MSATEFDHPQAASARPEMTAALMARTGLDEGMLTELVHGFYAKARSDAIPGPLPLDIIVTEAGIQVSPEAP